MGLIKRIVQLIIDMISMIIHPIVRVTSKDGVVILNYHRICNLPNSLITVARPNTKPENFARQMELLFKNGYNVISIDQYCFYKRNNDSLPPRSVIITFDDGLYEQYFYIPEILKRYGYKATFFVCTGYISYNRLFMSEENIKELSMMGHCIASHTRDHRNLSKLKSDDVLVEVGESKKVLESMLGEEVRYIAPSGGHYNNGVIEAIKRNGYEMIATIEYGRNNVNTDTLLRRITIETRDTIGRFQRKIDGAYDWWYGWLLPLLLPLMWWEKNERNHIQESDKDIFSKSLAVPKDLFRI